MSSSLDIFALEHKGMANSNSLQPGKSKDSQGLQQCKRMPNWKLQAGKSRASALETVAAAFV
jgi:hypothetical protein